MAASTAVGPSEVYLVFSDQINQASTQRVFQNLAIASQSGVRHAHLLLQSSGGFIGDGICLYNFFKSLPVDLTVYNAGSVQSIATVAYLGAKYRKASAHATFQIHQSAFTGQAAQAAQLEALAEAARIDNARIEDILRSHLKLSEKEWNQLSSRDLVFCGQEAVKRGFADEIAEFMPPAGSRLFNT